VPKCVLSADVCFIFFFVLEENKCTLTLFLSIRRHPLFSGIGNVDVDAPATVGQRFGVLVHELDLVGFTKLDKEFELRRRVARECLLVFWNWILRLMSAIWVRKWRIRREVSVFPAPLSPDNTMH
jgi:hypothetical protein